MLGGSGNGFHLHLHVLQLHGGIGLVCWEEDDGDGSQCADDQRDCSEEAEYGLDAVQGGMHGVLGMGR